MKKGKEKSILILLHIIVVLIIMSLAFSLSGCITNGISAITGGNVYISSIAYAVLCIGIALSAGLLYAKYVLHFTFEEVGVCLKAPQLKWVVVGFVLPLAIAAFYIIFIDGSLIKNENAVKISPYLFNAIFMVGLTAGVCEEFVFRGLIMRTLERRWNSVVAVLVPSVVFGFMHAFNKDLGLVDFLLLMVAGTSVGIMFSLIALQSGTIWSGAAVHAIWDAIIGQLIFITETADSGTVTNYLYKYELLSKNIWLTGGRFGVESALPAVVGYILVSLMALALIWKFPTIRNNPEVQENSVSP